MGGMSRVLRSVMLALRLLPPSQESLRDLEQQDWTHAPSAGTEVGVMEAADPDQAATATGRADASGGFR